MLSGSYYMDMGTNHLPCELFRNILFHGLRLKEYGWVNDFIDTYSPRVHPNDKENILNYGLAYLNFNIGNYEKAQDYLNKIEQSFFVFKVDVKNLMLMIYYELGYTEEGLSLIKSYREFIRRNKLLSRERQKRYHNFAKCLEKLIRYRAGTIKTNPGLIKRKLMKNNLVAFKDWLFEKIDVLQTSRKKAI
jgi:tetratricopeptide (TPR) repeat protein